MRRMATILAVVALMVTFSSSVAVAAFDDSITGTDRTDIFTGTDKAERISGLAAIDEIGDGLGQDTVYGGAGKDNLIGQGGDTSTDRFVAGSGDDTVQPWDSPAVKDVVNCGPGTDKVYADKADVIKDNCERVRVQ